jgi:hypothetical protein
MNAYPRENKRIDGFNEEELFDAMQLYTNKVKAEIVSTIEQEYGIRLDLDEEGEMLTYFHRAIDLAMTQGMELAASRWKMREYYEEQKKVKIDPVDIYEFEDDKGISGILFADGTFKKCGNSQHQLLVSQIPFDEQTKCLYFSCLMFGKGDGLVTHSPVGFRGITEDQKMWLKKHFQYLDRGQKRTVRVDWDIDGED